MTQHLRELPTIEGARGGQAGDEGEPEALCPDGMACGHGSVKSALARDDGKGVPEVEVKAFARRQREFCLDLFKSLSGQFGQGRNAMVSAYGVHQALGMALAGARGETFRQMDRVLRFGGEAGHAAQNALTLAMESRCMPAVGEALKEGEDEAAWSFPGGWERYDAVEFAVSNALWSRKGAAWKAEYLGALARNYGAGVEELDFAGAPEESRRFINAWVARRTHGRILDLLDNGSVGPETGSILTDAVYFKAPWNCEFDEDLTKDGKFHLANGGGDVTVPFLHETEWMKYAEGEGWKAVERSFRGGKLAMLFILPAAGTFGRFEREFTADALDAIAGALACVRVSLTLPRFTFSTEACLSDSLKAMGMPLAFDAERADFSGMASGEPVVIGDVVHKTFIDVREKGVEAAAATACVSELGDLPGRPPRPKAFKADSPFLFAIRDVETGAVLFFGRVMDPSAH